LKRRQKGKDIRTEGNGREEGNTREAGGKRRNDGQKTQGCQRRKDGWIERKYGRKE
jgi:hypothetical protein